jgi:GxxExxY protein
VRENGVVRGEWVMNQEQRDRHFCMRGELLEAGRVQSIVGGFFAVYNYFGYGLSERVYSGALACELHDRGHVVERELSIEVQYKGQRVAGQRLDMVVDDKIVVELKATERLSPADRMQLLNYLRASNFEVGLLLHFGPTPRFERYIDHPKRTVSTSTGPLSAI